MNSRSFVLAGIVFLPSLLHAQNTPDGSATPAINARQAAPAFVTAVTFKSDSSGDEHTLTVLNAPGLTRIDAPDDRLSVLYDPATEHYTGLETSNDTYWEFVWPQVRAAVEGTARYATRLRDVGPELLEENAAAPSATNSDSLDAGSAPAATDSVQGDDSGYVWHTTTEKKRIAGYDCAHWVGETVAGETIDAWCAAGLQPDIEQAVATLKEINEPMALVPVHEFVPPLVFVAWGALTKAGVTPIQMTWGGDTDANKFTFIKSEQREGKLSYFQIPKLYRKTTLLSMDGIGTQKPTDLHREPEHPPAQVKHDSILPGL